MIATNYKKDAVRYLEAIEEMGDLTCAVVIFPPDMREGAEDVDDTPDDKVIKYWTKMMNQYGNSDTYEKAMRAKFEDGEIDLIIVCSKLLTGFDAHIYQALYIDKEFREHGLLQAIARTNRLRDGKDYSSIVDYRCLIHKLDDAMNVYSGAGLEEYEAGDLKGVVTDVMSAVGNLYDSFGQLEELFLSTKDTEDSEAYEVFLADEEIRNQFYKLVSKFGRDLHLVLSTETAYQAISHRMTKSISEKYDENPAYYDSFSKRIKNVNCNNKLNTHQNKVIPYLR
ncbi:MAG: hypothetical protein R3Y07_10915 [Eubacteriales bacterium]